MFKIAVMTSIFDALQADYTRIAEDEIDAIQKAEKDKAASAKALLKDISNRAEIVSLAVKSVIDDLWSGKAERLNVRFLIRERVKQILRDQGVMRQVNTKNHHPSKGMTPQTQAARNESLNAALIAARKNEKVREKILELVATCLEARFPLDMFNMEDQRFGAIAIEEDDLGGVKTSEEEIGKLRKNGELEWQQMNDLANNFLIWFAKNISDKVEPKCKNQEILLVAYLYLFHGLDAQRVVEKMGRLKEDDLKDVKKVQSKRERDIRKRRIEDVYSEILCPEKVEQFYTQLKSALEQKGPSMLDEYLRQASFNDYRDRDVVGGYERVKEAREQYFKEDITKTQKRKCTRSAYSRDLFELEKKAAGFAATHYERCLQEADVILLQRGDVSARNRVMASIFRLVSSALNRGKAKYRISKAALFSEDSSDVEGEALLDVLEKLPMCDPMRSKLTTYVGGYVDNRSRRYIETLDAIRSPSHVIETKSKIWAFEPWSIDRIVDQFHLPEQVVRAILEQNPGKRSRDLIEGVPIEIIEKIREKHTGKPDYVIAAMCHCSLEMIQDIRSGMAFVHSGRVSLDAPVDNDPDADKVGDFLPEAMVEACQDIVADASQRNQFVEKALKLLSPNDARFLRQRLIEGMTLEAMGEERYLTRERIRQLEAKLLKEIRDRAAGKGKLVAAPKRECLLLDGDVVIVKDEKAFENWCNGEYKSTETRECRTASDSVAMTDQHKHWLRLNLGMCDDGVRYKADEIARMLFKDQEKSATKTISHVLHKAKTRLKKELAKLKKQGRDLFIESYPAKAAYNQVAELLQSAYETI